MTFRDSAHSYHRPPIYLPAPRGLMRSCVLRLGRGHDAAAIWPSFLLKKGGATGERREKEESALQYDVA